jgi:homoaconitate hydratase
MTHDNSFAVISKWHGLNAKEIHDPEQLVMTLDHDVGNKSKANLDRYSLIEKFCQATWRDLLSSW